MKDDMMEDGRCPFCGASISNGEDHSCQNSEVDEYYRMQFDEHGSNCAYDFRKDREEWDKMWGPNFEKGTIVKGD